MTTTIKAAIAPEELTAVNLQATIDHLESKGFAVSNVGTIITRDDNRYVVLGTNCVPLDNGDLEPIVATPEELAGSPEATPEERQHNVIEAAMTYDVTLQPLMLALHALRMKFHASEIIFGDMDAESELMEAAITAFDGGAAYLAICKLNVMFSGMMN